MKHETVASMSGAELDRFGDVLQLLHICALAARDTSEVVGSPANVQHSCAALCETLHLAIDLLKPIHESLLDSESPPARPLYTPGPDQPAGYRAGG